ncbi:MAG TPA: diacylglycerol kinase family protein, partial [Acidimicrobiia bacterium]|nr:diacylglycerol kinase family protein [Acidimicrobiia bacterium]
MTVLDKHARATTRGIVLVNPHSGPDETDLDDLRARFGEHDVVECEPADIATQTQASVDAGRPFVAVAGGDGTIRCAAEVLANTDVALLPIPAGTHNHFAKALGIATLDDAILAAKTGHRAAIDVARVNGKLFVNNSSLGTYPGVVAEREQHEGRMPKPLANVIAVFHQLRAGRRLTVDIDGRPRRAWLVFVGNGAYGENLVDITTRESLRDGVLDVRIVRADQRFARLRLIVDALRGRLDQSPVLERRTCRA